jgi:cystathionine beta-lyase
MHNFDEIIERKNTDCLKYDALTKYFNVNDAQPLWVADMDFKTPKFINDAIIKRAQHGIYGYAKATPQLLNSIVNWMHTQHQWNIDASWISLANGVVPAYSAAIEAFSNEGDEIIVQTPVYYPLFNSVKNNNRKLVTNPLKENNGYYTMDLEDLKNKITPKTKILTLCSPHNPVGRVWDKEELEALAQICLENNIIIISDEIHADIVFKKFTPLASISKAISNITLTLNAAGKTFNIAGLNCSYAICENEQMLSRFNEVIIQREINSINVFGFTALQSAYENGHDWLKELLAYVQNNITFVQTYLKETNSKITFEKPEATYLLWFSFKNYNTSHQEVKRKLLKEAKVALNDGLTFGKNANCYFRLNCALPRKELEKALCKIVTIFDQN